MINPFEDVRYALRGLRKSPMFTIVALLSLGLGIGANTAVFSLMDQALLRSLPVKHPEQLVLFSAKGPRRGQVNTSYGDIYTFSYPMYRDFRDGNQVFSGVLARFPISFSASWHDQTERIYGDLVSGNYFDVLGVHAAIGRTFTPEEDRRPGANPVVVLSYGYWKGRFGGDPGVLNQTILLNAHPMTIVGIAQPGFKGVGVGEAPDVFVPMMMRNQMSPLMNDLENRRSMWLNIFGRLKPGISLQQAEAALNTSWRPILELEAKDLNFSPRLREQFLNRHLSLLEGRKGISAASSQISSAIVVLMCMVGLLLLIACANVANLLIARATARQREISIRLAMGASRMRLVRQWLVESLLLALGGGMLGMLVAEWTGEALLKFLPSDQSMLGISSQPDQRVLLFALALSVVTGVLFGIVPSLQATKAELASTLKDQAAAVLGGGRSHLRLRKSLVVTQVALSLMLLIGAGLFARSLYNVKNIDAGFHTDHLISFAVQPSLSGYSQERMRALFEQLQQNIARLPGIRAASLAEVTLLSGDNEDTSIQIEGYQAKEDEDMVVAQNKIGPGFFATLGIPLLAGRDFTNADGPKAPLTVIVNERLAKHYFGDENPIGRRIQFRREKDSIEIVGVVRDGKIVDLREKPLRCIYLPYAQAEIGYMTFYARTTQQPSAAAQMLREEVRRQDPNLPIFNVRTMVRQIDESLFMDRLVAALSASFGALATLLAAVGLYGVMAYMVVRRTREIGIRMALGAGRREVLRLVMKEVVMLAAAGIGIAVLASLGMGRLIQSQLLDVSARDPWVMAAATLVLGAVALLAGFLPALRATRVDPLTALRYE
ncbi:MAG TPA: ABC transporter permease [Bryobacteraceae bacterium]|nr:ABC transporter permease [Bryobacteraceae bacterium]